MSNDSITFPNVPIMKCGWWTANKRKETFLSHWYLNRHDLFENFVFNKCSFYFCFFFVYYDFSLGPVVFLSISCVCLIWSFFLLVAVIFHSRALSPDMICFYSLFVLCSMFKQFSKLCLSVLFVIYTCFIQEKIVFSSGFWIIIAQ